MNNSRITPKEWGLIKGALRRVFSRSELRNKVIKQSVVSNYNEEARPRVKKWSVCPECNKYTPTYLMVVDHVSPIVPINVSVHEMSIQLIIDNMWCAESNLQPLCKECHSVKTKAENKARRTHKKERSKK